MSQPREDGTSSSRPTFLRDVIRDVKNAAADRGDVVVDIREGQRTRLELLAEELQPVFDDVPRDDPRFDFVISSGEQPRLWIDAVSHVTMARDRRTYRFLRDTRLGRLVLAESSDMTPVVEQVTRYIAERIVERERELAGEVLPLRPAGHDEAGSAGSGSGRAGTILRGIGMVLLGGLVGIGVTLLIAWGKLPDFGAMF